MGKEKARFMSSFDAVLSYHYLLCDMYTKQKARWRIQYTQKVQRRPKNKCISPRLLAFYVLAGKLATIFLSASYAAILGTHPLPYLDI